MHKCNFKLPFIVTCQTLAVCLAHQMTMTMLLQSCHDPFIEFTWNLLEKVNIQHLIEFILFLVNYQYILWVCQMQHNIKNRLGSSLQLKH